MKSWNRLYFWTGVVFTVIVTIDNHFFTKSLSFLLIPSGICFLFCIDEYRRKPLIENKKQEDGNGK